MIGDFGHRDHLARRQHPQNTEGMVSSSTSSLLRECSYRVPDSKKQVGSRDLRGFLGHMESPASSRHDGSKTRGD